VKTNLKRQKQEKEQETVKSEEPAESPELRKRKTRGINPKYLDSILETKQVAQKSKRGRKPG
jgi:hypothetical protein